MLGVILVLLVSIAPILSTMPVHAMQATPISPPGKSGRIGIDRITACPQIVKNPSFEQGLNYWDGYPYMPQIVTSPVYEGAHSIEDIPEHYGYSLVYQYLPAYEDIGHYDDYDAIAHVYIHKEYMKPNEPTMISFELASGGKPVIEYEIYIPPNTTDMKLKAIVVGRVTVSADIPDTYDRWLTLEIVVTDSTTNPSMDHVAFYYNGQQIWQGDVQDIKDVYIVQMYHHDLDGPGYIAYWDQILFYDLDSC